MKIGIITAMNIEAKDYIEYFKLSLVKEFFGLRLYLGNYKNYDVSLMVCGCGKVNATYAMKYLIDSQQPDCILHSGIAGGISPAIQPLDLVLATTLTYHDVDQIQMSEFPPYMKEFICDKHLSNLIMNEATKNDIHIKQGRIISGDSFIASSQKAKQLAKDYQADMVDMESAAIAQVCNMENIPVIILRCASDKASDEAEEDYKDNKLTASFKASDIFIEIIKKNLI